MKLSDKSPEVDRHIEPSDAVPNVSFDGSLGDTYSFNHASFTRLADHLNLSDDTIRSMSIHFTESDLPNGFAGIYLPKENRIEITASSNYNLNEILIHELSHAADTQEKVNKHMLMMGIGQAALTLWRHGVVSLGSCVGTGTLTLLGGSKVAEQMLITSATMATAIIGSASIGYWLHPNERKARAVQKEYGDIDIVTLKSGQKEGRQVSSSQLLTDVLINYYLKSGYSNRRHLDIDL